MKKSAITVTNPWTKIMVMRANDDILLSIFGLVFSLLPALFVSFIH